MVHDFCYFLPEHITTHIHRENWTVFEVFLREGPTEEEVPESLFSSIKHEII